MGLLRLLLAVSIILYHSGPIGGITLVENHIAVQLFFIISGFMISYILDQKYMKNKKNSILHFYKNRFLRIFPMYWVILGLTIGYSFFLSRTFSATPLGSAVSFFSHLESNKISALFLYCINNIFLINIKNILSIVPQPLPLLVIPAWTLHVELLFYCIAPFVYKRSLKVLITLLLASLRCRFVLYSFHPFGAIIPDGQFFPLQLLYFILGIVSYHFYKKIHTSEIAKKSAPIIFFGSTILVLSYQFLPFSLRIGHIHPINWLFEMVIVFSMPFIFLYTRDNSLDRYLGRITYIVYLIHPLVILLLTNNKMFQLHSEMQTILVLLISGICGIIFLKISYFVRFR